MSLRSINNHLHTLNKIFEYNNNLLKEKSNNTISSDNAKLYAITPTSLFNVSKAGSIFSQKKVVTSLVIFVIFIVSQLVLNYIGLIVLDVEERPVMLIISQIYNIFSSYFFPMILATQVDENVSNPFQDLHREVGVYKNFKLCAIVQFIGLILSIFATIEVFTKGPYYDATPKIVNGVNEKVDMTTFVQIYQMLSLQLLIGVVTLSLVNLILTDKRMVEYFNRIDGTRDEENLKATYISHQLPNDFYESALETHYGSHGDVYHGAY